MALRDSLRFICDEQLGRLAKWLRLQGLDTRFRCPANDSELIRVAQTEGRVLLTRDRHLFAKTLWKAVILIEEIHYVKQLRELQRKIRLPRSTPFSRCLSCNELIQPMPKEQVRNRIPPQVYASYHQFYTCPACKKIFWRGSHVKRSEEKLRLK